MRIRLNIVRCHMSTTVAVIAHAVPIAEIDGRLPDKYLSSLKEEDGHSVIALSRNGRVIGTLKEIIDLLPFGADLYLLNESCILTGESLRKSCETLESILRELEGNPGIVCRATGCSHKETTEIHSRGFKPLPATIVYPPTARIENGWVYFYTESEVVSLLRKAQVSHDPKPPRDDEGESLEFAFSLLKSHLSLLRNAVSSEMAVVFNRYN